ncbi:hypothetical protein D0Z07_2576 [Hyphodiscus hymeniophilus]|uniref:Uncharacterized protein n=1 Tax=Hyphodiscus hymeniophilus TaxID=353542 RepID=A0A9P6VN46_9HELO|nr:hypothetical protein D0Z07_2576 [Hyphodiscus hymeniophilus]
MFCDHDCLETAQSPEKTLLLGLGSTPGITGSAIQEQSSSTVMPVAVQFTSQPVSPLGKSYQNVAIAIQSGPETSGSSMAQTGVPSEVQHGFSGLSSQHPTIVWDEIAWAPEVTFTAPSPKALKALFLPIVSILSSSLFKVPKQSSFILFLIAVSVTGMLSNPTADLQLPPIAPSSSSTNAQHSTPTSNGKLYTLMSLGGFDSIGIAVLHPETTLTRSVVSTPPSQPTTSPVRAPPPPPPPPPITTVISTSTSTLTSTSTSTSKGLGCIIGLIGGFGDCSSSSDSTTSSTVVQSPTTDNRISGYETDDCFTTEHTTTSIQPVSSPQGPTTNSVRPTTVVQSSSSVVVPPSSNSSPSHTQVPPPVSTNPLPVSSPPPPVSSPPPPVSSPPPPVSSPPPPASSPPPPASSPPPPASSSSPSDSDTHIPPPTLSNPLPVSSPPPPTSGSSPSHTLTQVQPPTSTNPLPVSITTPPTSSSSPSHTLTQVPPPTSTNPLPVSGAPPATPSSSPPTSTNPPPVSSPPPPTSSSLPSGTNTQVPPPTSTTPLPAISTPPPTSTSSPSDTNTQVSLFTSTNPLPVSSTPQPTSSSLPLGVVQTPPPASSSSIIPSSLSSGTVPQLSTTQLPASGPEVITIGSSTITANSASDFIIGSATLTPGGQVTVGGTTVSLASNGGVLATGTNTEALTSTQGSTLPPVPIIIGSLTITQGPSSALVIGSQTLTPGSAATISGDVISLDSGGAIIVNGADGSSSAPTSTPAPVVVVDGSSITENSASGFVIGNQTLFPGSAITTGGEVITLPLPSQPTTAAASITSAPIFLVGSSTFTENSQSDLVIGTETLTPGGVMTVDGQVISLSPTGNAVIVNGAPPSTFLTETASIIPPQVSSLIIGGETLTAGGRVTVGGDILSLAPSGTGIVVIGTVTVGGGESTATATTTGKKKNVAGRVDSSRVFVACQVGFVIMVFWLH